MVGRRLLFFLGVNVLLDLLFFGINVFLQFDVCGINVNQRA